MTPSGPAPEDPRARGQHPAWGPGAPTPDSWVSGSSYGSRHPGSQAGSQPPGSQYPGSAGGSQYPGSQYPGSQAGSQYPGSAGGSQYPGSQYPGSQAGSQYPGSHPGSAGGSHYGSQAGSAAGSRFSSGSWAPGVPLHGSQTSASQAGPRRLVSDEGAVFLLERELGRGGMGVVYQAYDDRLGRPVALKIGLARDTEKRLKRFLREGEIAASLEHPGIVRVHSSGTVGGRPYLCFELVAEASTLSDSIQTLPLGERLRLVVEVGEALGFAHAHGVVHRDVKPENVLIDDGHARLTDFGVALGTDQERLTNTGTTLGTPYYAAPEQLRDGHRVGPPADVWSLGVLLYEALTGELPFQGESLMSLVAKISAGFFEPPRSLEGAVSPALEAVCLKALQIEVEDRYPSGTEFAADLQRAIAGEATEAEVRGRSPLLGVGLVAALLVGVGLLVALRPWAEVAPTPTPTPSAQAPEATPTPAGWKAQAEQALAAGDGEAALVALQGAPAVASALVRARALILLRRGPAALAELEQLPADPERSILALRATVHGAQLEAAQALVQEAKTSPQDPRVLRWAFLAAAARPASLEDLKRTLRRVRRAKADTEELRSVLELYTKLEEAEWPIDPIWSLAEESGRDPRLPRVKAELETAKTFFPAQSPEGEAVFLGLQRWLVPRMRFAMARLDTTAWAGVSEAGIKLLPSVEADELRLQLAASLLINHDSLLPRALSAERQAELGGASVRLSVLPPRGRLLWKVLEHSWVLTRKTPSAERWKRLQALGELLPPLAPDGAKWTPAHAQSQEVELVKVAFMVEATRIFRDAWQAKTAAERERQLSHYDVVMAAAREKVPPEGIRGDWRDRATSLGVAILRHDTVAMLEASQGGWNDASHDQIRLVVTIEGYLRRGKLEAAKEPLAELGQRGTPKGWSGLVHNQLLFLEDPKDRGKVHEAKEFSNDHPYPWYSKKWTQRALKASWKPGQPLLSALGRE
jgi:protein kinase-like protein